MIVAAVLIALSAGLWWLQRVAFTPSNDSTVAHSILGDEEIRGQVATIVAGADAPVLGQSPAELREFIEQIARIPEGAALPDVGDIERIEPQLPRSRDLAAVLRDALGNLRIEWD